MCSETQKPENRFYGGRGTASVEAKIKMRGLLEVVADEIRARHPQLAAPLVQRWTGAKQEFGNV